ncbi:MAG TPA: hypothetical protein VF796_22165, partial [Humisphaera sp.]
AAGLLAAAAAAFVPSAARADAQADYASLFGAEEKKVLSTPSTRDDAAFAATLLGKAGDLKDAPDLRRLVLARAVELGQKDVDGLATAVEAAKLFIAESKGAEKLAWQSKLTDLYAAQYRNARGPKKDEAGAFLLNVLAEEADSLAAQGKYADGARRYKEGQAIATTIRSPRADEFADAAKELQARQAAAQRLDRLKARADTQGGDIAALEQLILGYLFELNDLKTAQELAAKHTDKAWERMVAQAGVDLETLSNNDLLDAAAWWRKVGESGQPANRPPALSRALACLGRLQATNTKQDAVRLKTMTATAEVLKALGPTGPAGGNRFVIWNSHHGPLNISGTRELNLILLHAGKPVWRLDGLEIGWVPNRDVSLAVPIPQVSFDTVRVEIVKWVDGNGSLAEVQVMKDGRNVALGAKVTASAAITPNFHGGLLTDGITTSAQQEKGYWLLPVRTPGWAEIHLQPPIVVPRR